MTDLLHSSGSIEETLTYRGNALDPERVVEIFNSLLTEDRRDRINNVIDGRSLALLPVIEGLVNTGNVSAVMRSAEALGCTRVDVVVGGQPYKHSKRTTQGADKWLDIRLFRSPSEWVNVVRREGFRIVVTHLDESSVNLDEIDFSDPTAVVFGNELSGVSAEMASMADVRCRIPTVGFVQSFNISVAAAIVLHHARESQDGNGVTLSEQQATRLRAAYYLRSIAHADQLLDRFYGGE